MHKIGRSDNPEFKDEKDTIASHEATTRSIMLFMAIWKWVPQWRDLIDFEIISGYDEGHEARALINESSETYPACGYAGIRSPR